MSRSPPGGGAATSGRVRKCSGRTPSSSSSCRRACSPSSQVRTGRWRSATIMASGRRLRWTGLLPKIACGPGCSSAPSQGTRLLRHRGMSRRRCSGRRQTRCLEATGTRLPSVRGRRTVPGCARLSSAPSMRCWATGQPSARRRQRWSCRRERARPRRCLPCWWPPGCPGCWCLSPRMRCVSRLRRSSRRSGYCRSSASSSSRALRPVVGRVLHGFAEEGCRNCVR